MKRILLLVTAILLLYYPLQAQDKTDNTAQTAPDIKILQDQIRALVAARQEDKAALDSLKAQAPKPDAKAAQRAAKQNIVARCQALGLEFDRVTMVLPGNSYQITCK